MIRRTLLALAIILAPVAAGAHVTITPKTAAANGSTEYVLRVPTEKDVPTISLRLVFPDNFEVLRFRSAPGWTMEVERNASGRITGVTWTGRKISREEYEQFSFLARSKTPGTYKIEAYQTYDGGEVVGWVNPAEPRPAPQVTIAAATTDAAAPAGDPFAAAPAASASQSTSDATSPSRAPMWLGGSSLLVALVALALSTRKRG